jgi:selenocysteine lyase/cysteine desulfurase
LLPVAGAAIAQLLEWGVADIAETLGAINATIEARLTEMGVAANPARAPHYLSVRFPGGLDDEVETRLAADEVHVSLRGDRMRITPHLYNHEEDADRLVRTIRESVAQQV